MQLAYFIIPFLSYLKHVTSAFHCVGTCYSGRLFSLPEDIVYGKHLKGHSYRNITTDDSKKCYSSCVNDCRCKACQTKDARCELLDEDHTSKPSDFVAALGYVYYDLKQGFYKGLKSHMVQPGVCHNGCCQFQTCMNGGTCIEHCDTPKKKFSCKCPHPFIGKLCEKEASALSCLDYLKDAPFGTTPPSGNYTIRYANNARLVFCDFIGPSQAWTLIDSFSRENTAFKKKAYGQTARSNYESPNWNDYRISPGFIKYMRRKSTMFRATCDFPNRDGVLTPDYLFGYLRDYDILKTGESTCFNFAHMNVRGYDYFNVTVKVAHLKNRCHLHIICTSKCPGFNGVPKSVYSEDCFGYYGNYNTESKCTATPQSTTQWWLGEQK